MITNFIAMNSNPDLQLFKTYVLSFYGYEGIYPIAGLTGAEVEKAIMAYLTACSNPNTHMTWGDGDSLDRERVRDILLDMKEEIVA